MRKLVWLTLIAMVVSLSACSAGNSQLNDDMVFVEGGAFKRSKSSFTNKNETLDSFYIGKYEVTQKEWMEIMGENPSGFKGDDLPVEMVSWYDAVEYCNQKSIKEICD